MLEDVYWHVQHMTEPNTRFSSRASFRVTSSHRPVRPYVVCLALFTVVWHDTHQLTIAISQTTSGLCKKQRKSRRLGSGLVRRINSQDHRVFAWSALRASWSLSVFWSGGYIWSRWEDTRCETQNSGWRCISLTLLAFCCIFRVGTLIFKTQSWITRTQLQKPCCDAYYACITREQVVQ